MQLMGLGLSMNSVNPMSLWGTGKIVEVGSELCKDPNTRDPRRLHHVDEEDKQLTAGEAEGYGAVSEGLKPLLVQPLFVKRKVMHPP